MQHISVSNCGIKLNTKSSAEKVLSERIFKELCVDSILVIECR